MERLGISSACYYPLTTEESFRKLCENNIKCIEVFFNSPSELSDSFIKELVCIQNEYGVAIPSVHPFASSAETLFLFSSYERRFYDILDLYKRYCDVMNRMGAEILVIHGSKIPGSILDNEYCERFHSLIEIGKEYGIKVCQENVVHYKSESIDFIEMMCREIGDDFGMVLDIKQAKRAEQSPFDFVERINKHIRHIHISDHNSKSTCIPPCSGEFDFNRFFNALDEIGYNGRYIIELYEHSYENDAEIYDSYNKISKILVD